MNKVLSWLTTVLAVMAVACSIGLLASDMPKISALGIAPGAVSAAPLLLIGVSFLVVQAITRPRWTEFLRNTLLAIAFLLWGVVQTMGHTALSAKLGDVVIVLYVLDLAWVILATVNPAAAIRSGSLASDSSREGA